MFSDESRFSLQSDSRRTFIWRAPGTRYHQENTIERHRYGGAGWLVWGGIILGSKTDLHVQSVTMTGHIYRDVILEQHVRLFRGAMGAEFLFMDDNTRPHRANIVDECLQSEDITRMDWPAYSPDLNPIENVWDMLGRRIAARQPTPTCLPELRRALLDEWCNIPQDQIDNLILSMPRRFKNIPRTGRPRCFTEREEKWIVRKVTCNPKTSAVKLTLKAQQRFNKSTNSETVRNILRKYNFHGRVARRKPFISKEHPRARLEFAKSYIKKPPEFWNSVLFVDESKHNVFGSDGKQMVLRKPNELEMKNLTPSVKPGGGSQMVWGCMSAVDVRNLHFIDGMMDKYMYLDILKQNLQQSAEKMGILPHYKLYQDNDPNNNAHICRLWALYHCP
ncbi:Transposable element Tc3 transposase [Araneus ventricosus]|uniref:Transposable element Tc3 transposase n=1 Tax=Araneus ventricosus TaxID=182803 RepID=A0A4Y2MN77_ARAVE|nr:Transposable element Tc3 transposase [Araneus ventricosus]